MKSLATIAGFDPLILDEMPQDTSQRHSLIGLMLVTTSVVFGLSFGALVQLSLGFTFISIVCAAGGTLFWLNLHRLMFAGAHYSPWLPAKDIAMWRPARVAIVGVFLVGAIAIQPMFAASLETVSTESVAEDSVDPNTLMGRMFRVWSTPVVAVSATVIGAVFFCGPLLFRRSIFTEATREYERQYHKSTRAAIVQDWVRTEHDLNQAFSANGFTRSFVRERPFEQTPLVAGREPGVVVESGEERLASQLKG